MKSVKVLKKSNVKGKYILIRVDFNVPIDNGKVLDKERIFSALPTIKYFQSLGGRIILISHIGREKTNSLKPVYEILKKHLALKFIPEIFSEKSQTARAEMKNGEILLLENLRQDDGEKEGSLAFAKKLASLGDIYVNEAFPVSHRSDASIVKVPALLPSYAGIQFEKEVKGLGEALAPKHPFLFILGGAKAETKLPLLKRFLKVADHVFVGGVLANDILTAKGIYIGDSKIDVGLDLENVIKNKKLILPADVIVEKNKKKRTVLVSHIEKGDTIVDIGLPSIEALKPIIKKSKLILWNGPMGYYEGGNVKATEELLKILSESKAEVIIGGGDTAVLVHRKNLADKFDFVSTAGGAALEYLAEGTLVGIKALK